MRRILVTGASGFVGGHVLQRVRDAFASDEILGVGRRTFLNVPDGVSYERLDLIDSIAVARRISTFQPTDVLHLAAESSIVRADRSKFDTWRLNFGAVYNLIDALEQAGKPASSLLSAPARSTDVRSSAGAPQPSRRHHSRRTPMLVPSG